MENNVYLCSRNDEDSRTWCPNQTIRVPAVHTIRTAGGSFFNQKANIMENKKPQTVQQQVELLQDRGMSLDKAQALAMLSQVSYFRLKPYWWDMRDQESDGGFLDTADFSLVIDRYNFDRTLRLILFEAIEIIEISLRTKIINHLSEANGSLWYLDNSLFMDKELFREHLLDLKYEFDRSKDGFVEDFKQNNNWIYDELGGDNPDAWQIFEVATFGTLSKIYKNLNHQLPAKAAVAKDFGMYFSNDFSNWLEGISVFRNMIAHHSRLWNFRLTKTPTVPKSYPNPWLKLEYTQNQKKTPFFTISNMLYLCNAVRPDNQVKSNIKHLIASCTRVNLRRWGFVSGWEKEPIWR